MTSLRSDGESLRGVLLLAAATAVLAGSAPLHAQRIGVSMRPSVRPWTEHPFQTCRESVHSDYQTSRAFVEKTIQEMARAGVELVRFEVPWLNMEPAVDGQYDWEMNDLVMRQFRRYDLAALPLFLSASLTAGSGLTGKMHPASGPDLQDFILDFIERYETQVDYVEIGNEPNQIYFVEDFGWGRPHLKYVRDVLIPTSVAVKRRYPNIKILNGGEFRRLPDALFWSIQIPSLGTTEVAFDHIDVFSVHYIDSIAEFQAMRDRLDTAGYSHIPIWVTECDFYDSWARMSNGFTTLVNQAYPIVEAFFDYCDVSGWQYRIDQSSGYRYTISDGGGILGIGFDRTPQSYIDFTTASGGPFNVDSMAPRVGVSFSGFTIETSAPNTSWSADLPVFNLGRQSHNVSLEYAGAGVSSGQQSVINLPGGYGENNLHVTGTMPASGSDRVVVLARSMQDGRFADMNRVVLRGDKGSILNGSAQYSPEYARLFDAKAGTNMVLDRRPEDIEMTWPRPVRIEQIEIRTSAGDLVDIASSYVTLDYWNGAEWTELTHFWSREGREASGPYNFYVVEDCESMPVLPFNADRIRFRVWHKTRIATINVRGNANPGNSPARCDLKLVSRSLPNSNVKLWAVEGTVFDPDGFLLAELATIELEWNGAFKLLGPLHGLQAIAGPLPFFHGRLVSNRTYKFNLENTLGFDQDRHSFVLRVVDRQRRKDLSLVTVDL